MVELFADLRLLEDVFCIYQKRTLADNESNRLVTDYLLLIDPAEFGDSIGPVPRAHR